MEGQRRTGWSIVPNVRVKASERFWLTTLIRYHVSHHERDDSDLKIQIH